MIQTWKITPTGSVEIDLDALSLDSVTRQLPDGYYSTFRTYDRCTRVLGLKSHLRRLYDPVTSPEVTASELRWQLTMLLEAFRPDEARVRVIMTKQGQVYAAVEPLVPLPSEVYDNGVCAETTEIQRQSPRLKSTTFIGASESERKHIAQEGIFEALLVKNGRILEGLTSNFFYVMDSRAPEEHRDYSERSVEWSSMSEDDAREFLRNRASSAEPQTAFGSSAQREILCTAQRDILPGVTRRTVIHLARGRGVAVKYQALKLNRLLAVKETFITSSSRGIVPVVQIDDVVVGQGRPGPITQLLMAAYNEYVLEHAEKI